MSKIALVSPASGTATFSITTPSGTSTDRTLTLPDAAGTVFVSGQALSATTGSFSGNVTLGSSVLATPSGSAPSYTCRAWVNFNGTGTVAIRASGNVSSITDNGTGDYTVNFTTAMPDANYSSVVSISADVGFAPQIVAVNNKAAGGYSNVAPTTSAFRFTTGRASDGLPIDELYISASVFR